MSDTRQLRYYGQRQRRNLFSSLSVTYWLVIVNAVLFVISFSLIGYSTDFCEQSIENSKCYLKYLAANPYLFFQGKYLWTVLTSVFMHGSFFHLLVNMFVLFSLGTLCERIIGRKRFFWFYLISGVIASLFFVLFAYSLGNSPLGAAIFGSPLAFAVGASGAIFAIAGLFMILTPKLRFSIIFLPFFSLPAYIMIPLVLVLTWIVSSSAGVGIGNTAHFGGFLAGVIYGLYLRGKYRKKTKMIERYFSG